MSKLDDLFPKTFVNVNGNITNAVDAKISIFDRGFLYGDSIYEVTLTEDRSIIFWEEHLDRLENSAHLIGLPLSLTREQITEEVKKTLVKANLERAYIRLVVTRGEGIISLDPNTSTQNNFVIITRPFPPNPSEWYQEGVKLCFVSVLRNDKRSVDPNAKSGNYLNNVLAINEAKQKGFFDALMVNKDGYVTEGTTFNIWLVKDGVVKTPSLESGLLKGITRTKLLKIIRENNIPFEECSLTPDDFHQADEVFMTASTKGIVPVNRVDEYHYNVENFKRVKELTTYYQGMVESLKNDQKYRY
jgi:branched-chain amino acid aminotransferase